MNRDSIRKEEFSQTEGTFENFGQDSRKKSIIESITDIVVGFLMYLPINFFVLPMFSDQIANQEEKTAFQQKAGYLNLQPRENHYLAKR